MSQIKVQFLGLFQSLSGVPETSIEGKDKIPVGKLLCLVAELFPQLGRYLGNLNDDSQLFNDKVTVFVNGVHVFRKEDLISLGDTVVLMVPFCGG
ncbi:hypothetical protein SY88_17595 [Clostridiales bacterium PH28_bin88]|nr:hypothetical protein SY88_17595 [Clostridiales bacterium PH28_bin88]